MPRYMEQAAKLRVMVEEFMDTNFPIKIDVSSTMAASLNKERCKAAKDLGYIISQAVKSHTRAIQSTVRRNIVQEAVGQWCDVHVKKEVLPANDSYLPPKIIKKVIIQIKES